MAAPPTASSPRPVVTGRPALVILAAGQGRRFGGLKQLSAVGPNGEVMMDYTIHDGFAAGFERVVVVVRPDIGAVIRGHLHPRWFRSVALDYAVQPVAAATGKPGGTAPAVLSARPFVGEAPLAVVNADDLYGRVALRTLHDRLASAGPTHALVGYRLAATILPGSGPVSRAICHCGADGSLDHLEEATITVSPEGTFLAGPAEARAVGPDALVSMNAWGFRPTVWPLIESAVEFAAAGAPGAHELLLPDVVADLLGQISVDVVAVTERCLSVTWPGDLATVQGEVAAMIAAGRYPDRLGRFQ